jgi:hypothetical protein
MHVPALFQGHSAFKIKSRMHNLTSLGSERPQSQRHESKYPNGPPNPTQNSNSEFPSKLG